MKASEPEESRAGKQEIANREYREHSKQRENGYQKNKGAASYE